MFKRNHHNAVLAALHELDADLFERAECYFGGGTAIVLQLDEYRESIDIDFLCASAKGYRELRQVIWGTGLQGLLAKDSRMEAIRDVRTDQYGIRAALKIGDTVIKFEIVREARVELNGEMDPTLGVPVLDRDDMYTEKLLANADRWVDASVMNRDIIDLSMMINRWGPIPDAAWEAARGAYGDTVDDAYQKAVARIRSPEWLAKCMTAMSIDDALKDEILAPHGGPKDKTPSPFD